MEQGVFRIAQCLFKGTPVWRVGGRHFQGLGDNSFHGCIRYCAVLRQVDGLLDEP
jgi:hypothetical protein